MQSTFGWVDFLEEDKNKMYELIKLLSEQETLDELGIGSIRDAFSNLFFPGTSTIQTRVKYMFFIPWIYQRIEDYQSDNSKIDTLIKSIEVELIDELQKSEDTVGIIGKNSREKLKRTPADIYWAGLKRWGILKSNISKVDFHQYLSNFNKLKEQQLIDDDNNPVNGTNLSHWDQGISESPEDFPKNAIFNLRYEDAIYLKDKIKQNCKESLMANLLDLNMTSDCKYIWDHPGLINIPQELANQILNAQYFADIIQGASLLYNLMLSEADENLFNDKVEEYRNRFRRWKDNTFL